MKFTIDVCRLSEFLMFVHVICLNCKSINSGGEGGNSGLPSRVIDSVANYLKEIAYICSLELSMMLSW